MCTVILSEKTPATINTSAATISSTMSPERLALSDKYYVLVHLLVRATRLGYSSAVKSSLLYRIGIVESKLKVVAPEVFE